MIESKKTAYVYQWLKSSNISKKLLLRHNRKGIKAYDYELQQNDDVINFKSKCSN